MLTWKWSGFLSGRNVLKIRRGDQQLMRGVLVLLRHRNGWRPRVLRGAWQHGHRARVVARATIRYRRIVAIEFATCRSGRMGGASGWTILGNAKRRELIGGVAGG